MLFKKTSRGIARKSERRHPSCEEWGENPLLQGCYYRIEEKPAVLAVTVHTECLYNIYTHRTKIATRFFLLPGVRTRVSVDKGQKE